MIEQIAEINRVLITADALCDPINGLDENELIDGCKRIVIESRMPDHQESIQFSVELGLLSRRGKKKILLTGHGREFLDLNPESLFDLSEEQKQYLIRGFFFDGALKRRVRECLKCFVASDSKGTFTWSEIDGTPFGTNSWIVSHLEQLGLIIPTDDGYAVDKTYAETVSSFVNEPKGYTEEQLLKWLEEKKKLGNFAEELILDFEKKRLRNLGYIVESKCVKPVGKINTSAGYDIESFDGKSSGMKFNRFIEVKGSSDPRLRFVWTQNEIKVAEKLKDRYWIYYQGGIDKRTGTSKYKPLMIQDPFNSIDKDLRFAKTSNGLIIEASITGEKF